ncbi:MAG: ribosomal L7Ae/L30e/S12e/Gadd45 family protein [Synergistaceae bacterium]|nr:ribosomal L7Ae/L30e/S12e/Gadd45 family protein [Synergistaceae bacterium]
MPLNELAESPRTAGLNSVLRKIARGEAAKIFLADDADEKVTGKIKEAAAENNIPIETAESSVQLGRACAVTRKTAVAAVLKK